MLSPILYNHTLYVDVEMYMPLSIPYKYNAELHIVKCMTVLDDRHLNINDWNICDTVLS